MQSFFMIAGAVLCAVIAVHLAQKGWNSFRRSRWGAAAAMLLVSLQFWILLSLTLTSALD